MQETNEILADPDLVAAIKEGLEDIAAGRVYTQDEVEQAMRVVLPTSAAEEGAGVEEGADSAR
jgi:predicted transcriptional regulator